MNTEILEWSGCATGIIGSIMLACGHTSAGFGFIAYLLSNVCWIWFAFATDAYGLAVMQGAFTVTSLVGIYNWLIKPRRAATPA